MSNNGKDHTTIYLPHAVAERIKRFDIKVSKLCRDALIREADRLEKEFDDLMGLYVDYSSKRL